MQTDKLIADGNATLLVFSPDAIQSQLVGSIEHWIREQTECVPIARQWIMHTEETIELFYVRSIPDNLPYWHLVSKLFQSGPSLATLWYGENIIETLPKIKGRSHPAIAARKSIRGQFWCDNPVANLIHVSDDENEAEREIGVLQMLIPNIFAAEPPLQGLRQFPSVGPIMQRHSGVLTLCSLTSKLLGAQGCDFPDLNIPEGGDARETMSCAKEWLQDMCTQTPTSVSKAISSFLDGTTNSTYLLSAFDRLIPVCTWDQLILRCGLAARKRWLEV